MNKIIEREISYKLTLAIKNLENYYTSNQLKMAKNEVWDTLDNMTNEDVECISNNDISEFEYMLERYII